VNLDDWIRNSLFSLLLVFAACAAPRLIAADELPEIANARNSVRLWAHGPASCSMVVVAPGHAVTAEHCRDGLLEEGLVDGKRVISMERIGDTDAARIVAPHLACPCAPMASAPAKLSDRVFSVGFPYGVIRVLGWGTMQEPPVIPFPMPGMRAAAVPSAPGSSGGGVFSASGRLLGTISMTMTGITLTLYTELPLQ